MVPLPKRKISKGRRDRRRAHDALSLPNLVQCSQCGDLTLFAQAVVIIRVEKLSVWKKQTRRNSRQLFFLLTRMGLIFQQGENQAHL
jgi:hypothetical protein